MSSIPQHDTIDIEITNKCNATCFFCPRDATPHEGIMSVETFDKALERAIEYRDLVDEVFQRKLVVSLCGLGEPLLNKNAVSFVRKVKDAGFRCVMSSNGAPLTEKRAIELLDAGLDDIFFNVSDINEEYEKIYKIPFERTCENITRFAELAKDRCTPWIVLVDHRKSEEHLEEMKDFWRKRNIKYFQSFSVVNRAGALFVNNMQYEQYDEMHEARRMFKEDKVIPRCGVPWTFLFVGYDGKHYLCCSDWRKQADMGTIFDHGFADVMAKKLAKVTNRNPVCKNCNHDPINKMTQELRALGAGKISQDEINEFRIAQRKDLVELNSRARDIIRYHKAQQ